MRQVTKPADLNRGDGSDSPTRDNMGTKATGWGEAQVWQHGPHNTGYVRGDKCGSRGHKKRKGGGDTESSCGSRGHMRPKYGQRRHL